MRVILPSHRRNKSLKNLNLKTQVFISLFLTLLLLTFISCENSISSANDYKGTESGNSGQTSSRTDPAGRYVNINGSYSTEGSVPSDLISSASSEAGQNRSAIPLPSTVEGAVNQISYYVLARDVRTDIAESEREAPVNGTVNANSKSFEISGLRIGVTWQIEIGAKVKNIVDGNEVWITCLTALSSPKEFTETDYILSQNLVLKPVERGSGSVNLTMTISDSAITRMEIILSDEEQSEKWEAAKAADENKDISKNKIKLANLPSGIYELTLFFYKNENAYPSYITYQPISIINGMTTETWCGNGTDLITGSGASTTFNLTSAIIQNYNDSTIYVGPNTYADSLEITASNTNEGRAFSPLETLSEAITRIEAAAVSRAYKIYLSGSSESITLGSALNTCASSITVTGLNANSHDNYTDVIGGVSVETESPVTFQNLKIQSSTVGLQAGANSKVTLAKDVEVSGGSGSAAVSVAPTAVLGLADSVKVLGQIELRQDDTNSGKIKISGNLSNHSSSDKIIISNTAPELNLIVLEGSVSSNYQKFDLTPAWQILKISEAGKLILRSPITTIYVGGSGSADPAGDVTAISTWQPYYSSSDYMSEHPFASFDKALQLISWQNMNEDYEISISDELQKIVIADNTSNHIALTKNTNIKTLKLKGSSNTATISGNTQDTALKINTTVPVTLENLNITSGKSTQTTYGGGIDITTGSEVTINSGVNIYSNESPNGGGIKNAGTLNFGAGRIYNNYASYDGGGIYNSGIVYMYGSACIGTNLTYEPAKADSDKHSNYARYSGGGIYNTGAEAKVYIGKQQNGTVGLTGGIYYNYANATNAGGSNIRGGGGVFIESGEVYLYKGNINYNGVTEANWGYSGGVYINNNAKLTMSGGTINNNTAKNAGGVFIGCSSTGRGSFVMSGGTISGNNKNGVYVDAVPNAWAEFKISGDSYIPYASGDTDNRVHLVMSGSTSARINIDGPLTHSGNVLTISVPAGTTYPANPASNPDGNVVAEGSYLSTGRSKIHVPSYNGYDYIVSSAGNVHALIPEPISNFTSCPNAQDHPMLNASTPAEMVTLAGWVNAGNTMEGITIKLSDNIDLSGREVRIGKYCTNNIRDFRPFSASFDGNGKTITVSEMSVSASSADLCPALFGYVKNTTIKNLTVAGSYTTGTAVSGIVGLCDNSTIENCVSKVDINSTNTSASPTVGGIVSSITGGTIRNCVNVGNIYTKADEIGGIVGEIAKAWGVSTTYPVLIENCINLGRIESHDYNRSIGGIVGNTNQSSYSESVIIRNCKNKGELKTSYSTVGGIIANTDVKIDILNCCNNGNLLKSSDSSKNGAGLICDNDDSNNNGSSYKNLVNTGESNEGTIEDLYSDNTYNMENIYALEGSYTTLYGTWRVPASAASLIHSYNSENLDTVKASLNSWANENSIDGVTYARWKNTGNILELDLGDLDRIN
ncbi:hypothetical protein [Treponema bryantii]|uniref:hypothetical protein n=1 Tax=Treponema bryantii TaxID=163 RepID=UPI0004297C7E|nr:hypothetical protein [Treponema bryantii]